MSWGGTIPESWSSLSKYWIISTESIWLSPSYIRTKISLCISSAFWSFYIFTANRTIWVWFSIICTKITLFSSSSYTISTSFSRCSTGWTSWWKRFTSPANLSSKCWESWFSTCMSKSSLTEIISRPLCLSKRVVGCCSTTLCSECCILIITYLLTEICDLFVSSRIFWKGWILITYSTTYTSYTTFCFYRNIRGSLSRSIIYFSEFNCSAYCKLNFLIIWIVGIDNKTIISINNHSMSWCGINL